MILKSLTVENFRVFYGRHRIDLSPRERNGRRRPIILFGGLNGSGKTSLLTAVRLALYGADSLGRRISKRVYHEFLNESVSSRCVEAGGELWSEIILEYEHSENGKTCDYRVTRRWEVVDGEVNETLEIQRGKEVLHELSYDQSQSFLKDLVPIGVSELFFFDGEKISSLAEDEGSEVLRNAVYRLMGIDIVHRLRADLTVYLKEASLQTLPQDKKLEIENLERDHELHLARYKKEKAAKDVLEDRLQLLNAEINATERLLEERGGAWAASRSTEKKRVEDFLAERGALQNDILELMSGLFPLALAKKSLASLLETLEREKDAKHKKVVQDALVKKIAALKKNLQIEVSGIGKIALDSAVDNAFGDLMAESDVKIVHDKSDSEFAAIEFAIRKAVPSQEASMRKKVRRLGDVEEEIELASRNEERRPDAAFLANELNRLKEQVKQKAELEVEIKSVATQAKVELRTAIDFLKRLRNFDDARSQSTMLGDATAYAQSARDLLEEFAERLISMKVRELEAEFSRAFRKLLRKEDLHFSVAIDPESFAVTLLDADGGAVSRQQLSAGEKQIFAIAMLEALGRTTGRSLPIIIDTPLGRLDTKHRGNLVHNYFPTASHQVIILSTDTEVDEHFFDSLEDEISHGYEISFDNKKRSSTLNEGYFWAPKSMEAV